MKAVVICAVFSGVMLIAGEDLNTSDRSEPQSIMVGGDRDIHGCIASAGYLWCAKTEHCERPWELAERVGFENRQEAFEKYCNRKEEE